MAGLRQGIVVLDNSGDAQKAAYTAFHVAARSGMVLIGMVTTPITKAEEAQTIIRDFQIGARAARVSATTVFLPDLSLTVFMQQFPFLDAVMVSRQWAENHYETFLDGLPCPFWVIPEQRSIRRIMVYLENSLSASPALGLAGSISRSWGADLHLLIPHHQNIDHLLLAQVTGLPLTIDSIASKPHPDEIEGSLSAEPEVSAAATLTEIERAISTHLIDLFLIDRGAREVPIKKICQRSPCLVAVCPAGPGS
jgi:hypothetical protein